MAEQPKRIYKCSVCQEAGHNKAKCPSLKKEVAPKAVEEKPQLPAIYQIHVKEDNGDSVSDYHMLYASIDGLVKGLERLITDFNENDNDWSEESDEEESEREQRMREAYTKHCLYYTSSQNCKDIPIPTKEYVEEFLEKKSIHYMEGLMIKVSELGGASCFACEVYVKKVKLNA